MAATLRSNFLVSLHSSGPTDRFLFSRVLFHSPLNIRFDPFPQRPNCSPSHYQRRCLIACFPNFQMVAGSDIRLTARSFISADTLFCRPGTCLLTSSLIPYRPTVRIRTETAIMITPLPCLSPPHLYLAHLP